jgi:hypothetical protein
MRVLKHVPEIESKLVDGSLSITHLSDAQTFFRKEAIREPEQKKEILDQIVGKSVMDAQRMLMSLTSQPERHIPERVRVISAELTEVRFVLDQQTLAQLEELKAPKARKEKTPEPEQKSLVPAPVPQRTPIPIEVQRFVYHRDGGLCTYRANTGRRCGSRSYLDCDHIVPIALGGSDAPENLRLRCRTHNHLAAIRTLGAHKMSQYLPSIRRS